MTENNPKVSIILTSYNHSKFLRQSIESALDQTFSDFELIIIDDHSTDNSWEIIQEYQDKRIVSIRNEVNQRSGVIRNAIDNYTSGKYIAIHHSDDLWEPTKIEKQVNYLDTHQDVGAVFTHATIIDENNTIVTNDSHPYFQKFNQPNRNRFEWLRYFFYYGNALCNPSGLRRKAHFNKLTPNFGFLQLPDLALWVQLSLKYEIHVIQEELTKFRVDSSKTGWSADKPQNRVRIQYETLKILDLYTRIQNKNDLLQIFPEASQFLSDEYVDIPFALGMVATTAGQTQQHFLFGLNLLFTAINDPSRVKQLEKYFGFNQKAFNELTAKYDIFFTEEVRNLREALEKAQKEILFYSESKSWRYTKIFRNLSKWLKID